MRESMDNPVRPEIEPEKMRAIEWVRARGGLSACAQSVLVMTAGDARPGAVRRALQKAGAPSWVFSLIWPVEQSKRTPVEVVPGMERPDWWDK